MNSNYATHLAQLAQVYEMLKNLRDRTENVDDVFDEVLGHMSEMRNLKAENEALREALEELAGLMQGVIDGDYKPDSFTLQVANAALAAHDHGGDQ